MWPQQFISSILLNFVTNEVCYEWYGCFSNAPPYDVSLALLPQNPVYLDTTYFIHESGDRENVQAIQAPFDDLSVKIKTKPKTFIVTHGFIEHSRKFWVQPMIDALLEHTGSNVIFVDWEKGAAYPFNQAFGDSRVVAVEIAKLIERLHQQGIAKVDTIHLIGFSLGAHMMGRVGHLLKDKNLLIDRITGLDPAGPPFETAHKNVSLDEGDAKFVDVIHSDASTPLLGTLKPQGHVDFYPNGGLLQPGCDSITIDVFSYVSCSHYRAILYFIGSILHPQRFTSYKCDSYKKFLTGNCLRKTVHMGLHVRRNARGKFYLLTGERKPFTGNHYLIKLKTGGRTFASLDGDIQYAVRGAKAFTGIQTIDSDMLPRNSTASSIFFAAKDLGAIKKIKVRAYTSIWFPDEWFLTNIVIRKLGGNKRWLGCANKWIDKRFHTITLKGKRCVNKNSVGPKKVVEMKH